MNQLRTLIQHIFILICYYSENVLEIVEHFTTSQELAMGINPGAPAWNV